MKKSYHKQTALFFALLVVLFTPSVAFAQSIGVSASVSAPLPTGPAVITNPTNQSFQPVMTTTTSGTCPTNGAYVVIQRRASRIGTTSCDNGQFALPVSLIEGANELNAQIYNVTDDAGPNSETLVVYYNEPTLAEPSDTTIDTAPTPPSFFQAPFTSSDGNSKPCVPTALRLSHAPYSPINHREKVWQWGVAVTGGCPPYKLVINWGDGTSETQTVPEEATLSLTHTYTKAGSFKPTFTFTDGANTEATLQLLAVVNADPIATEIAAPLPANTTPLYEIMAYAAAGVITVGVGAAAMQAVRVRIKKP